jgi:hypothetical protein
MRTALNIEDTLIDKTSKMTAIKENTALVKPRLEALVARKSGERLAKSGEIQKN